MSNTVFTFPGKMGDAILQWPIAFHFGRQVGDFDVWMDERTCKPLVNLFQAQPHVGEVKLIGGIEGYQCGGQPFHFDLPTSAFDGKAVYHLGFRSFPVRQITLQTLNDAAVPIVVDPAELANVPTLQPWKEMDTIPASFNRLVIHGGAVYTHNRTTPTLWRFLHSIREELENLFDEICFVGTDAELEVGQRTYPEWRAFADGGDFLRLATFIGASRCMIGMGSAPITLAGALKVPAVRVHDPIGNDAPRVIWDNLGDNQLNDTLIGLRKSWPVFRDRWLKPGSHPA